MNDRAQRVLDALMDFDADNGINYPMQAISEFLGSYELHSVLDEDYESLTVEEEKQVIRAFLEFAY